MSDAISKATDLAVSFEGFRSAPYQDIGGVWTIGYGSTRDINGNPVTPSTPPISELHAHALVLRDMQKAAAAAAAYVKEPLTVNQTAAIDDFIYNDGAGAFVGSTLLRLLNEGKYAEAADQFDRWDHVGGKEIAGLLRRCEARRQLFLS